MKLTLNQKILAGFITSSLILFLVALISFKNSEKYAATNKMVNHTHEVLYELEQILVASVDAETGERGYIITGNDTYLEPFVRAKSDILDHLKKVKDLTTDNALQQKNVSALERQVNILSTHLQDCIEIRKTNGFEKTKLLVVAGTGKLTLDEIRKEIEGAKAMEYNLLEKRQSASTEDASNFNLIFIILLCIIGIVLVSVYMVINSNLKALKRAEKETADRNWTIAGSGELVKAIQGNRNIQELSQIVINQIAGWLDIPLGAIYITEEDNAHLRLAAAYAFDSKRNEFSRIRFGEGLAGQCAAENRSILFSSIPAECYRVHTAFGEVVPGYIFTLPLSFEGNVIGVIELGSIFDFPEIQKEYLGIISDSIAIAIASAHSRETTKELLEETQRQAEELEAQQEELKQANEELQQKTELLEESESSLKSQQGELQQANEELEEKANMLEEQKEKLENAKTDIENKAHEIELSSKYKSEFLANMSHELRTPLNSILILAQLLADNKNNTLGEKETEFAANIYNSGKDLLNLINEILDLSKIESGKMELDIEESSFRGIVYDISETFTELAKNRSIDFKINYNDKDGQANFLSDKQRVKQILNNLLSNAFKFTGKGGAVTLTIDKAPFVELFSNRNLATASEVVSFSVSDTGIGIPENKRKIIFEAFQQADGSTKRKYGGTGLGLSISRELASALGGEIHLESEENKGSTFTLFLPLQFTSSGDESNDLHIEIKDKLPEVRKAIHKIKAIETDAIDDRSNIGDKDKIILIIEDEEQYARILLDFVRKRNYKGIIAGQGNTGISYARHYRPDAIILDMKLPVMDGMEVLRQIKNDPELRHIPVQIISAYESSRKGLGLGAYDYCKKPISVEQLQNVFDRVEKFVGKKPKKLLVIEDDITQNGAIRELIGNNEVECFAAHTGKEAYEKLLNEDFDCIILDLGLPDISGFDLLEKIKIEGKLNKIPVVIYTGRELSKDENMRLGRLADTVVLKTAESTERLLDETTLFLHKIESTLPKEKQAIIRKLHRTDEVLKDKTILLVDDDIRNIYSLSNALADEGVECIIAENGQVALNMLNENPLIDLVLMDVMMPEMDGHEATMEIRKIEKFSKLPIIALTAKAMKGDREKCLAVGMSDYIAKPVNVEQLLSLMRVWLYK